jgi:hypothetical protein
MLIDMAEKGERVKAALARPCSRRGGASRGQLGARRWLRRGESASATSATLAGQGTGAADHLGEGPLFVAPAIADVAHADIPARESAGCFTWVHSSKAVHARQKNVLFGLT